jgi:hypothetical protein
VSGDIPAVNLAGTEINVGDKRSVFAFGGIKELDGIFTGRSYYGLESAVTQAVFDNALNKLVVFNDQDKQ